jgi:hypothetical protein
MLTTSPSHLASGITHRQRCHALLLCIALLAAGAASALPVGFKDSWMTMGSLSRDWSEASVVYSFTAQDAIGLGALGLRTANHQRIEMSNLHYNRRLVRWNMPQAQANIYLLLGAGVARGHFDNTQTVWQPGIQVDYETRRVYVAAQWQAYYADAFKGTRAGASAGFSFYATEYDEWQPWAILEVEKSGRDFRDASQITPYLRLIHKTLFIETGVPIKSGKVDGLKVNFRYVF